MNNNNYTPKDILDRWAIIVIPENAIYLNEAGESQPAQSKKCNYVERGYKGDEVLWIPPKDCIRIEFEDTPENNEKYIQECESVLKSLKINYCISGHEGKSDYINIFNIKNLPQNEDNANSKMLLIDQIMPLKAKNMLDRTNLGWTLSPVIGHKHWKKKYNGKIHKILRGIHPLLQENIYPRNLLKTLEKRKKENKNAIKKSKFSNAWVEDFLLTYCCSHELPKGARHYVIEKNLAAYIIFRHDKDEIKARYYKAQGRHHDSLKTWEIQILGSGKYNEVNAGELYKFITEYKINYDIPKPEPKRDKPNTDNEDKTLPEIVLPQEDKVLESEFAYKISPLIKEGCDIFYRTADNSIVEISDNKIMIVEPCKLITMIEKVCIPGFLRYNKDNDDYDFKQRSASEQTCKILLKSDILKQTLPHIDRIAKVPGPILKNDKLLFPKKGYNDDLKLFLSYDSPEINHNLSLEDAKKILIDIHKEFCFMDEMDITKAIISLLTPFLQGLYSNWNTRTPIFIYFANRERAGKDYLAGIRSIVFEGYDIQHPPISTGKSENNNDELRKKFYSLFEQGSLFFHSANNKGHINNSVLEQVATCTIWEDRKLGGNRSGKFENILQLSLSGNMGTTLTPDLANRSIIINLHLSIENANDRKFKTPNLHQYVMNNRGLILSALYSLIRNWYDLKMPDGKVNFSSFPEWAKTCGGIIESAGFINPLKTNYESFISLDRESEDMKILYDYIFNHYTNGVIKRNELRLLLLKAHTELGDISQLGDAEVLQDIFSYFDISTKAGQTKFGQMIDRFVGRQLGEITMKVYNPTSNTRRQELIFTKETNHKILDINKLFDDDNIKSNNETNSVL